MKTLACVVRIDGRCPSSLQYRRDPEETRRQIGYVWADLGSLPFRSSAYFSRHRSGTPWKYPCYVVYKIPSSFSLAREGEQ